VLTLHADDAARMKAHLERAYPEEGCGVLIGRETDGVRRITEARAVDNLRDEGRHNRYLIPPEQLLVAEKRARESGLSVLGFYHSHPDHPAEPSLFDLEHAWPWYSYLIASVREGRVTALASWRLADDRSRFDPEPVDVQGSSGGSDPVLAAGTGDDA
jgi:proteasome lid subunit RPN8/RPN11